MSAIEALAIRQLEAYNASDLEAFVACYHPEVVVMEGEDEVCRGREAFRDRYRTMFEAWEFGGTVPERLHLAGHCIDFEHYWRIDPETGERTEGQIMVHYHERDGLIGQVRFLR
jgi:hypothetical protein